jgi:hypothetical protein
MILKYKRTCNKTDGVGIRRLGLRLFGIISLLSTPLFAQLADDMGDESKLYAESKQVNQFFRRFNGEEDEKGKRYNPDDKLYHSAKLRKRYLSILFDESNSGMEANLKVEFVKQVLDHNEKTLLDFHGDNWFSEVEATFMAKGKPTPVTLFMKLEKNHLGYKWVIQKVHSKYFESYFSRDTARIGQFIHPLSHELDFMTLRKAFTYRDSISQFTVKDFVPDHLSLFLYEVKNGNLKFEYVNDVKFHFFQIDGWYFELAQFNRSGYNTGWLIGNLVKLSSESDENILKKYLYHETK